MFTNTVNTLCVCAALRRANRAVCHLYDLVLAPTGIRITQFIILNVIEEAGEMAHCDLARLFAASEETFSRRLGSARKAGWLQMRQDSRRRRVYCLTEEGRKVTEAVRPYWERAQARLLRELGDFDWSAFGAFTDHVTRAALRAEAAPSRNGHTKPAA